MGASQSTSSASRPPSPSSSSRQSRPPSSRRLSSFGRRGARSVAKEKEGLAVREHREEEGSPVVERDEAVQKSSAGSSDEDPDGVGVSEITESARTGKAGDIAPTPSLPTSPGPPIGYPSPQAISPGHASAEPSYFPPVTTTTESTAHSADTASCPMPQPTPTIILSPPISDPARPQSAAATRSAPTPPRPTHSRHLSLPSPASPSINDRTMSGRLTALLGFSAPGEPTPAATDPTSQLLSPGAAGPALPASDLPSTAADDDTLNGDITDLQARLEAARSELLAGQAELAELRQQRAERAARLDAARAELSERRAELEGLQARRVPVGAMLVIQGLAQTQVTTEPTSEGSSNEPNETSGAAGSEGEMVGGRARRPDVRRRISDGSLFRRRREIQRERGASLDQQARMISGLLTVAAAATANTLLTQTSPPSTPTPSRSGVSGAIQSLLDRLRPSRTPRHGIEEALGQYIRNTVRDRNISQGTGETPVPDVDAGAEFQAFLQGLQGDLVGAVRAYAGSVNSESEEISEGETTEDESTTAQQAEPSEPAGDHTDQTTQEPDLTSEEPNPAVTSIPRFHRQLGQNLPDAQENRFGVSGGGDQPRRLNFFRAHVFPPINGAPTSDGQAASSTGEATSNTSDSSGTTSTNNAATATAEGITPPAPVIDSETIVPCIFIGVRSIRHDPSTTPEDLFNQPDLFNSDSSTSESTSTPSSPRHTSSPLPSSSSSSTPALSRVMSPPVPSTPRSFRDRFLSRLSRSATRTLHRTPTNTYLVYVIGGNYPSNHPVLRIPNLISGGPLSDEDMALISELMGPAKPPTATKADIEQSGLRLVDGSEMRELGEKGEVLDNSTERCLICLGDYVEGEECRVLGCRHGFHKECVDRWLEKGSNSCPACRTEAVERTTVGASQTTQSSSPEVGQTPSLSSPIPVTSVPAAGLDISGPSRLDNID